MSNTKYSNYISGKANKQFIPIDHWQGLPTFRYEGEPLQKSYTTPNTQTKVKVTDYSDLTNSGSTGGKRYINIDAVADFIGAAKHVEPGRYGVTKHYKQIKNDLEQNKS